MYHMLDESRGAMSFARHVVQRQSTQGMWHIFTFIREVYADEAMRVTVRGWMAPARQRKMTRSVMARVMTLS
jgi:hypothetical protein